MKRLLLVVVLGAALVLGVGVPPAGIVSKIRGEAQAYNFDNYGYGFDGDPYRAVPNKYFGFLINAGLY